MEQFGRVEIKVVGYVGNEPLTPDNFDIREIESLFHVVETLLYPNSKQTRAPITYSKEKGSVRNIFKTTLQSAATFLATLNVVNQTGSLDGLELSTARALQEVQKFAVKNNFRYEFGSPDSESPSLVISRHTSYHINDNLWANTEFYFYGTVINAGGKEKPNIHLQTKDHGLLIIATPKESLEAQQKNILYQKFSVRAKGKQNIATRELDPASFELLEMTPFDPNYNEQYLTNLIKKASQRWKGVNDADMWLSNIRGING